MKTATIAHRRPRLLIPATTTLLLLSILVALGVWQVERLAWKSALLAALDQAEAAPAMPLPPEPTQFEKVQVRGRFLPGVSALYGAQVRDLPQGPVLGGQLLVPLEREGAPIVMVDRGWVPDHAPTSAPPGLVTVDGYIRAGEHPGWFSAADDLAGRRFFTLDPSAIGRALGLGPVASFTLVALRGTPGPAAGDPLPADHLPRPPNDHLSYAITWFGLAGALLIIFVIYSAKALRS